MASPVPPPRRPLYPVTPRAVAPPLAAAAAAVGWCMRQVTFVPAPLERGAPRPWREDRAALRPGHVGAPAEGAGAGAGPSGPTAAAVGALLLSVAAGGGAASAARQRSREAATPSAADGRASLAARRAAPKVDWVGSATGWDEIKERPLSEVNWLNVHGVFTVLCAALFLYQMVRIASHQAPSMPEVWFTTGVYLPWIYFCWRDTEQLENHYRVTFYASCGWGIMSLASLHSVMYQEKFPELAFGILAAGNAVFAASCAYFYGYHWTRMWRHYQQNRFRPLWIPGLLGLMLLHFLTVWDFLKRLDDGGWWKTVCTIYPDEWWWVADVRIIELFVTAAALWLIILHIQGVFTGMKNAALVVVGTIFTPLLVMVLESTWLRASAWQHYMMVGPKYW